ncbi:pentulose/hexulose kinase [Owenweeksia hongkongensis DSM 17368]|uniref:Pentulose/hexulose kinase n=1 Tax=Owenweeksia hongkongensis (strain DSM 17368 / CIP 108786 / JCM 12287 / NRRL B-23963 / UST20020801) TaxID=926562 RepID=G8R316_OWEHD|nr:FGGY family carbohydrate kinase [Owenweeksia hongkongensis]AEV33010.1 pentulose/hexulose kinase [Owenweeksia hongkongensis DSM 17368]
MAKHEVTAIFDIGKTNKKFFLFDDDLNEISREYTRLEQIEDEDGFPSEDLKTLEKWMKDCMDKTLANPDLKVKHLNFSTYGASLVHLDKNNAVASSFYNYLKEFPEDLLEEFLEKNGGLRDFAINSSSPVMGMLNSGLQLYYLKYRKPEIFKNIKHSLHFPQYLSFLYSGKMVSDYTSLGCHTGLWNFKKQEYHQWMHDENIYPLLPKLVPSNSCFSTQIGGQTIDVGVGVHDSSSALIPYLNVSPEPFMLISTGTWSICMNYFNNEPLTKSELDKDCLTYMRMDGRSIKASRLFLGEEHKEQIRALYAHFNLSMGYYKKLTFEPEVYLKAKSHEGKKFRFKYLQPEAFGITQAAQNDYTIFETFEEAYYRFLIELCELQVASANLAIGNSGVEKIYIDGGFSSNIMFVSILGLMMPNCRIFITDFALGTALGAALLVSNRKIEPGFLASKYNTKMHEPVSLSHL